jgi:hypothetical protein
MANYTREPRNDLIRKLRGQGWSLRRIGAHPKVRLSVGAVHAVLHADDADVDDVDDAGRVPPPVDDDDDVNEYVLRTLVADCMRADGSVDRESALWRLVFPTDPGVVRAYRQYAVKRFAEQQYL